MANKVPQIEVAIPSEQRKIISLSGSSGAIANIPATTNTIIAITINSPEMYNFVSDNSDILDTKRLKIKESLYLLLLRKNLNLTSEKTKLKTQRSQFHFQAPSILLVIRCVPKTASQLKSLQNIFGGIPDF